MVQVHCYRRTGRTFSVNAPDAHSLVLLDYMRCHVIDDYVVVCDVSHSVILIWIDVLNDVVAAQSDAFDADVDAADDDDCGDAAALVVVFLH